MASGLRHCKRMIFNYFLMFSGTSKGHCSFREEIQTQIMNGVLIQGQNIFIFQRLNKQAVSDIVLSWTGGRVRHI